MKYPTYLSKSLQVFIICFIIGTFIDSQFHKLQQKYTKANEFAFIFGFAQLITIITVTYILYVNKFFHLYFEEYSPNALFSTFLLSLQSNMINNFKYVMRDAYLDI
jgi:hypothetical protein